MDPVALAIAAGAISGVTAELAKSAVDVLKSRRGVRTQAADSKALENVVQLIVDLQERIRRLESAGYDPPMEQLLDDPGSNAVFQEAVIAASVSSSEDKRRLLARAIAERLVAPSEGMHALASAQAVAVIPSLSRDQLTLLAVAALLYSIRPRAVDLIDGSETNTKRLSESERAAVSEYAAWLPRMAELLDLSQEPTLADVAHLASTGCLIYDRHTARDFRKSLSPFGRRFVVAADSADFDALIPAWGGRSKRLGELYWYWTEIVQHVVLTPVGLLIGVAAFDDLTGETTDLQSVQRLLPEHDPVIEHPIWDGRDINLPFLDALSKAVKSLEERGVQPWRSYGERK